MARHMIGSLLVVACWSFVHPGSTAAAGPHLTWEGCGISKYSFMEGLAAAYQQEAGVEIQLAGGGATHGIRAVAAGDIDLGGSCRHGLDFPEEAGAVMIPVAWDALVVVVHPSNPIEDVSREQLAAVYSGEINTWQQLGVQGRAGAIRSFAREGKLSGVGYMSRVMLFADPEYEFHVSRLFPSSGPLEAALEQDEDALGLTGVSSARRRNLKILRLEGVEPSREAIMSGAYVFARPLFLAVAADYRERPEIRDFVRWARSERGQAAIRDTGSVPIMDITPETWDNYKRFMSLANQDTTALQRILAQLAEDETAN